MKKDPTEKSGLFVVLENIVVFGKESPWKREVRTLAFRFVPCPSLEDFPFLPHVYSLLSYSRRFSSPSLRVFATHSLRILATHTLTLSPSLSPSHSPTLSRSLLAYSFLVDFSPSAKILLWHRVVTTATPRMTPRQPLDGEP